MACAVASQSQWDATTRRPSVARPKPAALDSAGHGRLRGRTLAQWGRDRMSEAERGGGGTWFLFSQCSCCGDRASVPATWPGRASHPPELLNRRAVGVQQRRAGGGMAGGAGWGGHRVGSVVPSLGAPSKISEKATVLKSSL